jgi:ectoine hydroxylase
VSALAETRFDLTAAEAAAYRTDGFVVRERVFDARECAAVAGACEDLMDELAARRAAAPAVDRMASGSFTFDRLTDLDVSVKWERGVEGRIRGLEPFAHLSQAIHGWAYDPRLTDPCRVGCEAGEVALFTEKLNMKRPEVGHAFELHQDFPYWEFSSQASRVVTAMLYLDDTTRANGCLEVAPGGHTAGKLPQRTDVEGFDRLQMRQDYFTDEQMRAIEAPAGSVIWFGAFVPHRSGPNRTLKDRRALLFSYQPAGFPHGRELLRAIREKAAAVDA